MTRILMGLLLVGVLSATGPAWCAEPAAGSDAEKQIRAAVKEYVEVFNRGDAAAVASCWSEKAEYVLPDGEKVTGRKAIKQVFAKLFAENKGMKLEIDQPSIRVEGPNRAVEEGVAVVSREGQVPEMTQYVATYVKEGAAWKLKSVEEADVRVAPSHYEQLKELAWMAGEWADEDEDATVATTCRWSRNGNFLTRMFAVRVAGQADLEGMQIIGFDPSEGKIRSWVFDSDGGTGEGYWTRDGSQWTVQSTHVLPDGQKGKATRVITRVDDDTFTLRLTNREVGGDSLPDVDEVKVVRKQ
jgi:uncharacterized protein (TIGR02246 family)